MKPHRINWNPNTDFSMHAFYFFQWNAPEVLGKYSFPFEKYAGASFEFYYYTYGIPIRGPWITYVFNKTCMLIVTHSSACNIVYQCVSSPPSLGTNFIAFATIQYAFIMITICRLTQIKTKIQSDGNEKLKPNFSRDCLSVCEFETNAYRKDTKKIRNWDNLSECDKSHTR